MDFFDSIFRFRRIRSQVLLAVALSAFATAPASALTFEQKLSGDMPYLLLDGDISAGDTDRLEALLFTGLINSRVVALNSDGGSLWEGVILGEFLRYRGFSTYVRPKERCLSACLFAFMGGEQRLVYPTGELGGHQFYGGGSEQQNQAATQYSTADLFKFARKMGVSGEVIEIASSTLPSDMHIYTRQELSKFSLSVPHKRETFSTREARQLGISESEYQRRWGDFLHRFAESCLDHNIGLERTLCAWPIMRKIGLKR